MKAFILAAGLGTRLRPLTNNTPKALIRANDIPLMEIVIKQLKKYGFNEILINVHHFANQIINFLKEKNNFDIDIQISDETEKLLDTGGGLKKASWFFNKKEPFLLYNVDVISNINLSELYRTHIISKVLATLAVRNRKTFRYLMFDKNHTLCGWQNIKTGEKRIVRENSGDLNPLAYSGIQIISPGIFQLIDQIEEFSKPNAKFSIIELYLQLAKNNKITGFRHDSTFWIDMGKMESFEKIKKV